jgi:hypothetical protein
MTTTKDVQEAFARINRPRADYNRALLTDPRRVSRLVDQIRAFERAVVRYATEHGACELADDGAAR